MKTNKNNAINGVSIYDLSHTGLVMGAIGPDEMLDAVAAASTPFPALAVVAHNMVSNHDHTDPMWQRCAREVSCRIEEAMIEKAKELDALCMTYGILDGALKPDQIRG